MPDEELNMSRFGERDDQPRGSGALTQDAQAAPNAPRPLPVAAAPSRRKLPVSKGNLALGALFLSGLASVYLFSLRKGPAAASADMVLAEQKVDAALSQLSNVKGRPASARSVVEAFHSDARQRQIPLKDLAGNPFRFCPPRPVVASRPGAEPTAQEASEAKQLSEALAAVKGLKLQSVLAGAGGKAAMISSNLLTEGQVIRGWTVARIDSQEVELTWKGQTYVLTMPR